MLPASADASHGMAATTGQHPGVRVLAYDDHSIYISATGTIADAASAVDRATREVIAAYHGKIRTVLSSAAHALGRPLGNPVHFGLLGLLAGLSAALGFFIPPASRLPKPL